MLMKHLYLWDLRDVDRQCGEAYANRDAGHESTDRQSGESLTEREEQVAGGHERHVEPYSALAS